MVDLHPVTEDSLEACTVASLTDLLGGLVRGGAALGWTDAPTEHEIAQLLESLAGAPEGEVHAVLAQSGSSVVGFGYWRRYERPTHRPHADLEKLAVSPECAGAGLGRRLLRDLIESARVAGLEQLTLDFRGDNHAAEHLYLSEGFVEYGRLVDFVAPAQGRRFDKVLQVLDLRA